MTVFFERLLSLSMISSFFIIAVFVLRLIFKKAKVPSYICCVMWALAAIRLVFPFSIESRLSLVPRTPAVNMLSADLPHTYESGFVPDVSQQNFDIFSVLSIIWVVGLALMLIYMIASYISLRKRVNESIEVDRNICVCDRIGSPFIIGIFHPVIYLSSSIGENDKEYVIAHERAHISRLDNLWKPLGYLLLCVHWFNPFCWLAYILFCRDIELACDEKVVKSYDENDRKSYANALLMCSSLRYKVSVCPVAFAEVDIKQRVSNVLCFKKPAFLLISIAAVVCVLVAVCFMTNPVSGYSDGTAKNKTSADMESHTVSISVEPTVPKAEKPTEDKTMPATEKPTEKAITPATEKPTEKPAEPQTYDYESEAEDDYYSYDHYSSGGENYDYNNANESENYESENNGSNSSGRVEITPFDSSKNVEEYAHRYDDLDHSLISKPDNSDDVVQKIKWDPNTP